MDHNPCLHMSTGGSAKDSLQEHCSCLCCAQACLASLLTLLTSKHTPCLQTGSMPNHESMILFFLHNKFFPDCVSAFKSNKKALPDLVKLSTGASDCFPDCSNHSPLQAVPSPPLFWYVKDTRKQRLGNIGTILLFKSKWLGKKPSGFI